MLRHIGGPQLASAAAAGISGRRSDLDLGAPQRCRPLPVAFGRGHRNGRIRSLAAHTSCLAAHAGRLAALGRVGSRLGGSAATGHTHVGTRIGDTMPGSDGARTRIGSSPTPGGIGPDLTLVPAVLLRRRIRGDGFRTLRPARGSTRRRPGDISASRLDGSASPCSAFAATFARTRPPRFALAQRGERLGAPATRGLTRC
ncbi:hypothetical protein, partial [Nocardia xishanensis]|uniref:hypothetical protein n=1 Tax=Nocardia xishanensis TaxID=238964 RepID=UPI000AB75E16